VRSLIPLLLGVAVARGYAQSSPSTADSGTAVVPGRPVLGRNTRAVLLGTMIVGGAISHFDSRLSLGVQRIGGDDMRTPSSIGSVIGGPVPLTLGAALWAVGRTTGDGFAARLGREVTRAVLVSGAITALTKGAVGRARPFAAPGDPDVFTPGRGVANGALASFPSGHTSAAFATATVAARELHVIYPRERWLIDALLFGGAGLVGFSRVYDRQHWPSDVVAGAALGAITGYEVVAHARGDRSRIGRRLFSHVAAGPAPNGVALAWSLR
jgi:membrane-associated phospholipid phosphatase